MAKKHPIKMTALEHSLGVAGNNEMAGTRPDVGDELQMADELLASMAGLTSPVEPPKRLFKAIEAEIDAGEPGKARTLRADQGEWKKRSSKIWQKILHADPETGRQIYLLRCKPGALIPPHHHKRDEHILILEGELQIKKMTLKVGDCQFSPAGSLHAMIKSPNGCLVLVHA